jgi:hypothetical protein
MKSDITRNTFDRTKRYSGLTIQQGRVMLDADWNESDAIRKYFDRVAIQDTIGLAGTPITALLPDGGFKLGFNGANLVIGQGHYYVDGILCENDGSPGVNYVNQPVRDTTDVQPTSGVYLAYLDVYENFVSYWDDSNLSDPALAGRETAGRTKIVWRVRLQQAGNNPTCATEFARVGDTSNGSLAAVAKALSNTALCAPRADSAFRRTENQLYRVEVHAAGSATTATFKWSRENGSVVTKASIAANNKLTVATTGRDQRLSFAAGNWIELIDARRESLGLAGTLVEIDTVTGNDVLLKTAIVPTDYDAASLKVRRWESAGALNMAALKGSSTDQPVVSGAPGFGTYAHLEDGVWIRVSGTVFNVGDHWEIPARTITGDVIWPSTSGAPALLPKFGTRHYYAPLGLVNFSTRAVVDCRKPYALLNDDLQLLYLGGDGQSVAAIPSQAVSLTLPQTLTVGVCRGMLPMVNMPVTFTVTTGTGSLSSAVPVMTDASGIARVTWTLDATTPVQKVTARLRDVNGASVHLPIEFTATLNTANRVAYTPQDACTPLAGIDNVQDALDKLCELEMNDTDGGNPCCVSVGTDADFPTLDEAFKMLVGKKKTSVCICLRPGQHVAGTETMQALGGGSGFKTIEIHGTRYKSLLGLERGTEVKGLEWFSLRDLMVVSRDMFTFAFGECGDLDFQGVWFYQLNFLGTSCHLVVQDADNFTMRDSVVGVGKAITKGIVALAANPKVAAAMASGDKVRVAKEIQAATRRAGTATAVRAGGRTVGAMRMTATASAFEGGISNRVPIVEGNGIGALQNILSDANVAEAQYTLAADALIELSVMNRELFASLANPDAAAPPPVRDEPAAICFTRPIDRATIESCVLYEPVILYGLPGGQVGNAGLHERANNATWNGRGCLWMDSNLVNGVYISKQPDGKNFLEWMASSPTVFADIKLNENVFEGTRYTVAAMRVSAVGNTFPNSNREAPLAYVWGRSGAFMANLSAGNDQNPSVIATILQVKVGDMSTNAGINVV